jgi:hypothetical protein
MATTALAFFFLGTVAFLSGFSECWINVMFGKAERAVAASVSTSPVEQT